MESCAMEPNYDVPRPQQKAKPHMDIGVWLKTLELDHLAPLFSSFGGVEDLIDLSGRELLDLGVRKSGDRSRLATSLAILRHKYHKALKEKDSLVDSDGYISKAGKGDFQDLVHQEHLSQSVDDVMLASRLHPGPNPLDRKRGPALSPRGAFLSALDSRERSSSLEEQRYAVPVPTPAGGRRRLADQPWFHGKITRLSAQGILQKQGQFLVRSCISQPGDHVLSVHWGGKVLHFMINRVLLPLGDGNPDDYDYVEAGNKTLYQFEEEQFGSIVDLIDFHVSHRKHITDASGAVISVPVPRPLSKEEAALQPLADELQGSYVHMRRSPPAPPVPARPKGLARPNMGAGQTTQSSSRILALRDRVLLRQANGSASMSKAVSESQLHRTGLSTAAEAAAALEILAKPELSSSPSRSLHSLKAPPDLPLPRVPDGGRLNPPNKPTRAPSLTRKDRPAVIVRDRMGKFQEIPLASSEDYDDIDYADMDDVVDSSDSAKESLADSANDSYDEPRKLLGELRTATRPTRASFEGNAKADTKKAHFEEFAKSEGQTVTNGQTKTNGQQKDSKSKRHKAAKEPPSLPPRAAIQRDSACVPDFSLYDSPSLVRRPVVEREEPAKAMEARRASLLEESFQPSSPRLLPGWDTAGPLDDDLCGTILQLLSESAECLAEELAREDGRWLGLGADGCGLAQVLLPDGEALRRELLDRARTLSLFVTATVVKGDASTLQGWLEVAVVLAKLDQFALDAVVTALGSPEVEGLSHVWDGVRERKPSLYHQFQDSLLPQHWRGSGGEVATVPHLQPLLRLMGAGQGSVGSSASSDSSDSSASSASDDGYVESLDVGSLWGLLSTARSWGSATPALCARYKRLRPHPHVADLAHSGLHKHFLFGARGAQAPLSPLRFAKLDKVLSLMTEKRRLESF